MNKVLEFKNVSMFFCNGKALTKVIEDLSFDVNDSEIIALVGPSGCGKTTILNLISKLIKPSSGEITINGNVGYMFQKDHLFDNRNVYKNVTLGLEIQKIKDKKFYDEVDRMLLHYDLDKFKSFYPYELSGGMRQRVALIRTLATSPDIVLLDEPFSALDYQTKIKVSSDIYKIIKEEKKATIFVTHDISEAISMADRIITLEARPTKVKNIYDIKFGSNRDPISVRKHKDFSKYFDIIWRDLYE